MPTPQDIVILSIGPVQSYVSAARRTQDLRTASQLLSLLAQAACDRARGLGCEMVYPQTAPGAEGVPNRLVFLAPAGQGALAAQQTAAAIAARRDTLAAQVQADFERKLGGAGYDRGLWAAQVQDWLEVYWVAVPWDGAEASYSHQYRLASLGLDGRKGLRSYPAAREGSQSCTLCGSRSTLGGADFWEHFDQRLIRSQERLCAVCTLKRLLPAPNPFPSTASMASASYRAEIKTQWDPEVASIVTELGTALSELKLMDPPRDEQRWLESIEGAHFYPDFYQEERVFRETGVHCDPEQLKDARAILKKLNRELTVTERKAVFSHPNPYYAIVLLDGDHMGKLLDGVARRAEHHQISATLASLAQGAKTLVEAHRGRVIYSGGDDLLALLPVDSVLPAAYAIQTAFQKKLDQAGFPGLSMSAGIAVAHYSAPLQNTILSARAAEHEAKNECDRNAMVLHLAKRSGETRKVGLKWTAADGAPAPMAQIQELVQAIVANNISGKLPYDLWEEIHALADSRDNPSASWFELELLRLLKRHSAVGWKKTGELQKMAKQLALLWDFMPYPAPSKVEQIVQWLLVARFLAQGEQL